MRTNKFYHAQKPILEIEKAAIWFLIFALIVPLAIHGWVGAYSRYMSDDYCSANITRERGVLQAANFWYMNWTGRYSANLLDSLTGLDGPKTPFHTGAAILGWCISLFALASLLTRTWPRSDRIAFMFLFAALLPAVTLSTIPTVGQSLYYAQGMHSVLPPLILMGVMVLLLLVEVRGGGQTTRHRWLRRIAMACLAFVSAGFSETATVLQTGLLVFATAIYFHNTHSRRLKEVGILLVIGLSATVIGLLVMVLAPGNAFRKAFFPPSPGLLDLLTISAHSFMQFVFIYTQINLQNNFPAQLHRWIGISSPWIVFALIGSGLLFSEQMAKQPFPQKTRSGLWLLPLVFAILVFAGFAPAAYGMSTNIPGRAFVIPIYATGVGLAIWGYLCGLAFRNRLGEIQAHPGSRAWIVIIVAIVLGLNSLRSAQIVFKTQPSYASYSQSWSAYDRLIEARRKNLSGSIILDPVINPVFGFSELTSDPDVVTNQCMTGYYGIDVRTTAPPLP